MRSTGLSQRTIVLLIAAVLLVSVLSVYLSQAFVERDAFSLPSTVSSSNPKEQYELAKLAAEIRQIRSDTSGSLFWLKMLALFVTVGGALGGYLLGQSQATRARIAFEDRKTVDAAFQAVVQDLSHQSPILRAAAAVQLGIVLRSFPVEWNVSDARRDQLLQLTKQIMAAALAIETDLKVLKTLTISLAGHQPWSDDPDEKVRRRSDLRKIDLSGANARDAYWADVDLSAADFYRATLSEASLRRAVLTYAQLRETDLTGAVLAGAICDNANFKFADLRRADLSGASLIDTSFEGAKVAGAILTGATGRPNPRFEVDVSDEGDGSVRMRVSDWLTSQGLAAQVT
jgi:hypothetical protein